MLRTKTLFRNFLFVLSTAGVITTASAAEEAAALDSSGLQQMLDSLGLNKNDLEAKIRSTLMFGGSTPVSFFGEARLKLQYHDFSDYAKYLTADRTYLQSNWEGNESFVRIGMVARAGRNATLWSKIGFQHTLPGEFFNSKETGDSIVVTNRHDKANEPAIIHEDMSAGIAIRTVPASFWLKLGAVHWVEASPLTIWKSQPRNFAWEYLPFEVEQPIARYFEYNIAKGEKAGRAAWNKKAFQGINFESINLPGNLYFNFIYGEYERYDNFEREYADLGAVQGYTGDEIPMKGKGIGDPFRKVFHSRIAATELLGKMTPGFSLLKFTYDENVINTVKFQEAFPFKKQSDFSPTMVGASAFYKEPLITSIDLRGPVTDKLSIHADFALTAIDTTWFKVDTLLQDTIMGKSHNRSDIKPAFYAHVENRYGLPLNIDLAFVSKGFYSPLSFAAPVDGFYPFGANLLGPGKFIGRGEASPYTQNMAGVNLQLVPTLSGYGHLRITYGQHFQLSEARDVLFFPYRLNGQDLFSFLHSSYNRWGNDNVDLSIALNNDKTYSYQKRMGDETARSSGYNTSCGFEGGGLKSDYLAMYEAFVPYRDILSANANLWSDSSYSSMKPYNNPDSLFSYTYLDADSNSVTIKDANAFVPRSRKFTYNFEVDYAYDFSKIVGYPRDLFFSVYAALNGVSTTFKPLAFNEKNKEMLLWGTYIRFEPAIALTSKFYLLGLAGFERWASDKAYSIYKSPINSKIKYAVYSPIDYRDYAIGIGFDWDMMSRVGLHGRIKYMQHDDINIPENNYKTPVISTEIKMWF